MAATKLFMEADEDTGDKLSTPDKRISYAREFTAAAAAEEEHEKEDVEVKAMSNNRLVVPFTVGSSTYIAADAHHGYWREIAVSPGSCHVDAGMELSLITGNLDENYSFVTEHKEKASMRTYSEELAWVIEQRFGLQHMQAMIDLPSYPPSPVNEEEKRVQLQTGKMNGVQDTNEMVECLQRSGIVPATLDFFSPSCTLCISYKSTLDLKIGDNVFLRQISEGPPNVAILEDNPNQQASSSSQGTITTTALFTVVMVALDLELETFGGQYLHWIHANISNQFSTSSSSTGVVEGGNDLVAYESPKPEAKRTQSRYLFVAYAQQQQPLLHLVAPIKRSNFNLHSFATAHHFNTPVAALYITAAPNP